MAAWQPGYVCRDFYPRSPCGERRVEEGADSGDKIFLSTLSLRRATYSLVGDDGTTVNLSIHALLAESDERAFEAIPEAMNFYPRSPCGERLPRRR